jgi:hypothetical protein
MLRRKWNWATASLLVGVLWAVPAIAQGPQPPTETGPASAPAAAASQPSQAAPSGRSLGETANAVIDNLLATGNRLLELPLLMLLGGIGVVAAALVLLLRLLCRKGRRRRLYQVLLAVLGALVVLGGAGIVDRKIVLLQDQVRQLRLRMNSDAAALLEAARKQNAARKSFLFEATAAETALRKQFGRVRMQPLVYDQATDVVQLRLTDAVVQACLVIVDLQHPGLEIRLDPAVGKKRLTSEFARENDCTVAINGEAGRSSELESGLGEWKGNLVCRGQVILQEEPGNRHPFLAFDRQNRATYTPAAASARKVPPGGYNVISGRTDALLAGAAVTADLRNRQPRTAMAINENGTRLYLLVVDGRQPGYSMGLTRADVAAVLKAFGAHNGMLCDEGGSSCIFLKKLGGISNIPCDKGGQERPTYTHFGLALAGGG